MVHQLRILCVSWCLEFTIIILLFEKEGTVGSTSVKDYCWLISSSEVKFGSFLFSEVFTV